MNKNSPDHSDKNVPSTRKSKMKPLTFDEAFEKAAFGKFNYYVIAISGIILNYAIVEATAITYILPVSQCDLNITESEKGILGSIAFAGAIVSAQFWGFLADTLGRRKVLIPSLFLSFLSSVFSSVATKFWILVVLRFSVGFFGTGVAGVVYAYLGETHGSKSRARAIIAASFVFGFAYVLVPIQAWLVINQDWILEIPYLNIEYKPWRFFFVICGFPGLITSLCFLILPESPKFLLSQGKEAEAIEVLKRIYSFNTGKSKDSLDIHSISEEEEHGRIKLVFDKNHPIKSAFKSLYNQTAPLFQKEYIRKTVLASICQFGIIATSNGVYVWFIGIVDQMVTFMNTNPGNSTTICEVINLNIQAAKEFEDSDKCVQKLDLITYSYSLMLDSLYMIGFGVMGFIINVVGPIPIIFTIFVVTGLCGIIMVFVTIPLLSILLFVVLLTCGINIPVVSAATVDLYPTYIRSMAVCITLMMGRVGSLVGSNVVGLLIESHCETAFFLSGLTLVVCGFLAFLIPKAKKIPNETKSLENDVES